MPLKVWMVVALLDLGLGGLHAMMLCQHSVCSVWPQQMLEWMDALWSVFLEDQGRIKNSVSVKTFSGVQPLQEFRCGAADGTR